MNKKKPLHEQDEDRSVLAQRREELGLTQRKLAELANLSVQTISNIEQGRYQTERLEWAQLIELCIALEWYDIRQLPRRLGPLKRSQPGGEN